MNSNEPNNSQPKANALQQFACAPGWNLLLGDCIQAEESDFSTPPDLIYADPPFFTGKTFRNRETDEAAFHDCWENDLGSFLDFLRKRIRKAHQILSPKGSLLLHLDWRSVHYAKILCDEIFGYDHFQNEIIWAYQSGGGTKRRYGRKHDTILWYSKGRTPIFNTEAARVPYDAVISKNRVHLFHENGKVAGDVLNIKRPANQSHEWVGWPTQKPLSLLRWLVQVHTQPNSLIVDFFNGSGTTVLAAVQAQRPACGVDISPKALSLAQQRLEKASTPTP